MMTYQGNSESRTVYPVAWFVKDTIKNATISFRWVTEYNMLWAETGEIGAGKMILPEQMTGTNLQNNNQVELNYHIGLNFTTQCLGPEQGSIFILQNATIPFNVASVGIGMSGSATLMTQAQPNMQTVFKPNPELLLETIEPVKY